MKLSANLLKHSLAPGTWKIYAKAFETFSSFVKDTLSIVTVLPASPVMIAMFISHLKCQGFASSTIVSNVSALAYVHKPYNFPDPTSSFLVNKILVGLRKMSPSTDVRCPISYDVLCNLLDSSSHVTSSTYESRLIKAMYALMFFAFLRIGEVTRSPHNIQYSQISSTKDKVTVMFGTFKHHSGPPVYLDIQGSPSSHCPVVILRRYVHLRGCQRGPLFMFPDGSPITPSYFSKLLSYSTTWAGLQQANIKPHCFRIGAATHSALLGYSDTQIQQMGRWKSSAFKKYVRIQTFQSPVSHSNE